MDEGLVGIREYLGPTALVEDLDAVEQVDLTVAQALGEDPHDGSFQRPRAWNLTVDERARRQLCDELRDRLAHRREQLEQLAQAGYGVVGREELREHVAAAYRSREDDPLAGGGLGQLGQRRRGADHFEVAALDALLHLARHADLD